MSSRGRPRKIGLSKEEIEEQNANRLAAQEKVAKEKAAKRKLKNKGYSEITRKRPCPENSVKASTSSMVTKENLKLSAARFPIQESSVNEETNLAETGNTLVPTGLVEF